MIENPIKKNRYVHDIAFATKLAAFIKYVNIKYSSRDFIIKNDADYLQKVAEELVEYQRQTMTGEDEDYFNNLDKKTVINNR